MYWWKLLLTSAALIPFVSTDEKRCLVNYPEVHPKKYFHMQGKSLNITIEMSNRVTHQLATWVFYYYIKEILGYTRLNIIVQRDDFDVEAVLKRLTDTETDRWIANTTINLEVWIPPNYDTYVTDLVKECGSISPPGRFGWFIPLDLTYPIKEYYNPENQSDIKSIHWRHFRDRHFVKLFDLTAQDLRHIEDRGWNKYENEYICPDLNCTKSLYIPPQCKSNDCAVLLTSDWGAMKFVTYHIQENNLYVKVLFLGDNLPEAINFLKRTYHEEYGRRVQRSLVILNWAPSNVILHLKNFVTVSFESSERFNFTHSTKVGFKYEMHRLVKVAWNKVEKSAKPLYEILRSFMFNADTYQELLEMYEEQGRPVDKKALACEWLRKNPNIWTKWRKTTVQAEIYIGGIFPLSHSSYNGRGIINGALMARQAINNNNTILSDYKLQILITNGMCRADNVMKNFIDFIVDQNYYQNLVGVLGPACSDTVEPLAGVSRHYHIMVISYSAEGASFSNREVYPYFFRTIGENKHYKHVYLELFKRFKWKRVAALTEDGQKYTEYISLMQNALEQNNIAIIANKKFPRERETEPMTRYLEDLKANRARIIIADVVDEIARQVMCEAYNLKMTAVEGYVWFLPVWLNQTWYNTDYFNSHRNETVNCTTEEMIKAITGYFSMTHAYFAPDNQTMQENKTVGEWRKEYERSGEYSDYAGFAYDAVWVYALALDKLSKTDPEALSDMHSENTTNKLVHLIEQTDFYGVSGRIKFRGGPSRFSIINILQWYDNASHLIGEFYPNLTDDKPEILGGDLILKSDNNKLDPVRWFTSDGTIPEDGTLPLSDCSIEGFAKAFKVGCTEAWIIVNAVPISLLGILGGLGFTYVKKRYINRLKVQEELMEKIGIYNRKFPLDLDAYEVPEELLHMTHKLGEGAFGTVYGGEAQIGEDCRFPVAIKTLKAGFSAEDRIDFLTEADNMKRFKHENIVQLIGVITKNTRQATLMEYCLYGDLRSYLVTRRHLISSGKKSEEQSNRALEDLSPTRLTNMALDIARGLSYLAGMKYVHRDLACRNCLVNAQYIVKIGDFGMARPVDDSRSYSLTRKGLEYLRDLDCFGLGRLYKRKQRPKKKKNQKGILPVRWMAPECFTQNTYSTASDIWSFGVVLFEIVTCGGTPWYEKSNMEVVKLVEEGVSLEIPKGIKPILEAIMKSCWARDPRDRPNAATLVEYFGTSTHLLNTCQNIDLYAITLDDADVELQKPVSISKTNEVIKRLMPVNSNVNSPSISNRSYQNHQIDDDKVTKAFHMQPHSGCQEEDDDEAFVNIPANGYVNSNV
ncbi:retinal guanylyl cyclase 2-like isoform X2 [Anthonomus grandis grandis]|uniref:retinal guanylyl cyclase 2-like isoform X2 n=1 Tax=Anthonomus grandis grandis TaxID=2921223 RepID=UPI002165C6AB|nr:retinal guanylyl cyclase 2-like isoform X2 [Anthonomus grandis grandis]